MMLVIQALHDFENDGFHCSDVSQMAGRTPLFDYGIPLGSFWQELLFQDKVL
jgi:hypothetical protein